MGDDGNRSSGGGCFSCCFGGTSISKDEHEAKRESSGNEISVSSRTTTAIAREKDEAALATRRKLANAETKTDEDAFLREPWWDDVGNDDVIVSATKRTDKPEVKPGTTEFDADKNFEREMRNLERRHVVSILHEQRQRIGGR
tara:strand:- start:15286 stop:15714 length:429 start_codon:yes stop_codon:yes gene_type:complete